MGKLCVGFNVANLSFNPLQPQTLYKLETMDVPQHCRRPGQLKCLQKGKLLKPIQRAELRVSRTRQPSQMCQTRKLLYICCACFPVFQHPCKLLTADLRICNVEICITRYCMIQDWDTCKACLRLADLLQYQLFSTAALLPVFSYLHQAAARCQCSCCFQRCCKLSQQLCRQDFPDLDTHIGKIHCSLSNPMQTSLIVHRQRSCCRYQVHSCLFVPEINNPCPC